VVPEDRNVIISTNNGEPIILNERAKAAVAFNNIARRLTGQDVPIQEWNEDSFMDKLRGLGRNLFPVK